MTVDMCWSWVCEGNGTDVSWTGMCTVGFGNSTRLCLLLRIVGRWRSTSLRAFSDYIKDSDNSSLRSHTLVG
jgi:hypothetical protein